MHGIVGQSEANAAASLLVAHGPSVCSLGDTQGVYSGDHTGESQAAHQPGELPTRMTTGLRHELPARRMGWGRPATVWVLGLWDDGPTRGLLLCLHSTGF